MAESLNLLGQCAQPLTVIPLYRQLRKLIENEIAAGRWKPNERIPSEAELSRMFSVSRITVRAALTELADEGMLVKIQGKGTFVTNAKSKQLLTIGVSSFEEMCRQNDLEPKRVQLFKKLVDADERDMVQLGAKRGEKIVYLSRLLCADETPLILAEDRMREEFSFLMEEDLEKKSLNGLMIQSGLADGLYSSERTIEICMATAKEAEWLRVQGAAAAAAGPLHRPGGPARPPDKGAACGGPGADFLHRPAAPQAVKHRGFRETAGFPAVFLCVFLPVCG